MNENKYFPKSDKKFTENEIYYFIGMGLADLLKMSFTYDRGESRFLDKLREIVKGLFL